VFLLKTLVFLNARGGCTNKFTLLSKLNFFSGYLSVLEVELAKHVLQDSFSTYFYPNEIFSIGKGRIYSSGCFNSDSVSLPNFVLGSAQISSWWQRR